MPLLAPPLLPLEEPLPPPEEAPPPPPGPPVVAPPHAAASERMLAKTRTEERMVISSALGSRVSGAQQGPWLAHIHPVLVHRQLASQPVK